MSTYEALAKSHGTIAAAAQVLGIPRTTFNSRLAAERAGLLPAALAPPKSSEPDFHVEPFPDPHAPIEEVIARLARESTLKDDRANAEKWFRISMRDDQPIGILWFGDPHLGVSTNWEQLQRDVAVCNATPGLYGANIGDVADNWTGRLLRIAAEQDLSQKSEQRLAKWFLADSGVTWLVWLMGNHEEWNRFSDIIRLMDVHNRVPMLDWAAKFELHFPGGAVTRINAAHDFPGHSMWNNTHGPARAPRMLGDGAHLYVCGHKHTWGIQQYEMPEAGLSPLALRVRGYKRHDPYGKRLGFPEDKHGASILTVIDPTTDGPGRISAFVDVAQGARFLTALRQKGTQAHGRPQKKTPAKSAKRKASARVGIRKGGRRGPRRKNRH